MICQYASIRHGRYKSPVSTELPRALRRERERIAAAIKRRALRVLFACLRIYYSIQHAYTHAHKHTVLIVATREGHFFRSFVWFKFLIEFWTLYAHICIHITWCAACRRSDGVLLLLAGIWRSDRNDFGLRVASVDVSVLCAAAASWRYDREEEEEWAVRVFKFQYIKKKHKSNTQTDTHLLPEVEPLVSSLRCSDRHHQFPPRRRRQPTKKKQHTYARNSRLTYAERATQRAVGAQRIFINDHNPYCDDTLNACVVPSGMYSSSSIKYTYPCIVYICWMFLLQCIGVLVVGPGLDCAEWGGQIERLECLEHIPIICMSVPYIERWIQTCCIVRCLVFCYTLIRACVRAQHTPHHSHIDRKLCERA